MANNPLDDLLGGSYKQPEEEDELSKLLSQTYGTPAEPKVTSTAVFHEATPETADDVIGQLDEDLQARREVAERKLQMLGRDTSLPLRQKEDLIAETEGHVREASDAKGEAQSMFRGAGLRPGLATQTLSAGFETVSDFDRLLKDYTVGVQDVPAIREQRAKEDEVMERLVPEDGSEVAQGIGHALPFVASAVAARPLQMGLAAAASDAGASPLLATAAGELGQEAAQLPLTAALSRDEEGNISPGRLGANAALGLIGGTAIGRMLGQSVKAGVDDVGDSLIESVARREVDEVVEVPPPRTSKSLLGEADDIDRMAALDPEVRHRFPARAEELRRQAGELDEVEPAPPRPDDFDPEIVRTGAERRTELDLTEKTAVREAADAADQEFVRSGQRVGLDPVQQADLSGGSFKQTADYAQNNGVRFEVSPEGRITVEGAEYANMKEATRAVHNEVITRNVIETLKPSLGEAAEVEGRQIMDFVRQLPGWEAMTVKTLAESAPAARGQLASQLAELSSGPNPMNAIKRYLKKENRASMAATWRELMKNMLLTGAGTHGINYATNKVQQIMRMAAVGVEAPVVAGLKLFGKEFENPLQAQASIKDVAGIVNGYSSGKKAFWDVMDEMNVLRLQKKVPASEATTEMLADVAKVYREEVNSSLTRRLRATLKTMLVDESGVEGVTKRIGAEGLPEDMKAHTAAIGGAKGVAVRTPTRFLQLIDQAFKSAHKEASLDVSRMRAARATGMPVELFATRNAKTVQEQEALALFDQFAQKDAIRAAQVETFTQPGGKGMTAASDLIRNIDNATGVPFATAVVPYLTTPVNIVKYTGNISPAGLAMNITKATVPDRVATETIEGLTRGVVGSTMLAGAYMLNDAGYISFRGAPEESSGQARVAEAADAGRFQAIHMDIAGLSIPLNRMGPAGLLLAAMWDTSRRLDGITERYVKEKLAEGGRDGSIDISLEELQQLRDGVMSDSLAASFEEYKRVHGPGFLSLEGGGAAAGAVMANTYFNETSLRNASDLLAATTAYALDQDGSNAARLRAVTSRLAATAIMPVTAVSNTATALDPEVRSPSRDAGFFEATQQRLQERIPGMSGRSEEGQTQRTLFGSERQSRFGGDTIENPVGRVAARQFSPFLGPGSLETGDPRRDRETEMGQILQEHDVALNIPREPARIRELSPSSHEMEQITAFRGAIRFEMLNQALESQQWESLRDTKNAGRFLEDVLRTADRLSADAVSDTLLRQQHNQEQFDIHALSSIQSPIVRRALEQVPTNEESNEEDSGFSLTRGAR